MRTCTLLIFVFWGLNIQAQIAKKGLIDLSDSDLHGQSIELSGEWEFYWKQLVDPSVINRLEKDYYTVPSIWNAGQTASGIKLNPNGYATYRIRVILPEDRPELALTTNEMFSSYSVFYNGFEFAHNGTVASDRYDEVPDWLPKTTNFRPYSDTIEFVLHVSNFHYSSGGIKEPIYLGDRETLTSKRDIDLSYDFLLSGSLIMGGLFFLGLFIFGQHERSVLYFALFCISFSYRLIGSGEYALHALFPDMSWFFLIRAELFSLFLPPAIFAIYTHALYPGEGNKYILYGFSLIGALFSLMVLITPTMVFTRLVEPFVYLAIVLIFYMLYVFWLAYRRNRNGAQYALISAIIAFGIVSYQISIYYFRIQENTLISFVGFILFFFSQSLILSYRFAFSLKSAKNEAETASRVKSDFLSTISHEIRTPLNAVVGISHLLVNEDPKDDQVESLQSLQFSAEHLTLLINDILDYNKLESGSMSFDFTEVNLKELSQKMINAQSGLAKEKGLDLLLDFDPNIHLNVMADPTRLHQVVNNLLSNGIKFTSEGFVRLRLTKMADDNGYQKIRFQVSDSGIGIPEDKREMIFDRFTQAKSSTNREYGGTGLGLAIIKRILALFDSEILLESEIGKGTTFTFDLEFKKTNHKQLPPKEILAKENDLTGKRVLLVEDNRMNILVAEKFLKKWGMEIEVAMNGKEGVDAVKTNDYDIVLMDIQMPVMDGYEASREIRKFNTGIPIVALTASALLKIQEEVREAGMNDFLTKPFDPEVLRKKLIAFTS